MESVTNSLCRAVHPINKSTGTFVCGQWRPQRGTSPAIGRPTPVLFGYHLSSKKRWKQARSVASLQTPPDLREPSSSQAEEQAGPESLPTRNRVPWRTSVHCQPLPTDTEDLPPVSPRIYLTPKAADEAKEDSMQYRRTVFSHKEWLRHRSSSRHYRHILSIASSRVILALGPPVFVLTGVAFGVAAYNESFLSGVLPTSFPILKASSLPFQLTAPALALLLVFRTNASYARFLDARKAWGATLNRVRDIARQALCWMRDTEERDELLRYLVAMPYAFKDHMLREDLLVEDLQGILDAEEIDILLATEHRANYLLQVMSEIVSQTSCLTDLQRVNMDRNLTHFHDQIGCCERIFRTPIPLSYTRLTSRFLVVWHFFLPLALWDQCNWMVVPATFLSAAALFCIEEVGVLIEEPFSILPLQAICNTAEKNVEELIQVHNDMRKRRARRALDGEKHEHERGHQSGAWPERTEHLIEADRLVLSGLHPEVDGVLELKPRGSTDKVVERKQEQL